MLKLGGELQRAELALRTSEIESRKLFLKIAAEIFPSFHRSLLLPWNLRDLPGKVCTDDGTVGNFWMRLALLHAKQAGWYSLDLTKCGCGAGIRNSPFLAYFDYFHRNEAEFEQVLATAKAELDLDPTSVGYKDVLKRNAIKRFIPDWRTLKTRKDSAWLCKELERWANQFNFGDEWIFDLALDGLAMVKAEVVDKYRLSKKFLESDDNCWEFRRSISSGYVITGVLFDSAQTEIWDDANPRTGIPNALSREWAFKYTWPLAVSPKHPGFSIDQSFNPLRDTKEQFIRSVEQEFWAKFTHYYGNKWVSCAGKTSEIGTKIRAFDNKLSKFVRESISKCKTFATRTPRKLDLTHFYWLVDYQLANLNLASLAEKYGRDRKAIKEGIEAVSNLIGLSLRSSTRRGRPTGSKTKNSGRGRVTKL